MTIKLGAVSAALLLATTGVASAAPIFTITNGKLSSTTNGSGNLGTLTGTFTTNANMTSITSFDFIASAAGSFPGFEYTSANSSVSASTLPSQYFQIDSTTGGNELRIYFSSALTATGTSISTASSYESEQAGGNRFVLGSIAAAITAVPEAETWTLMILGLGAVGFAMRRRRVTTRFCYAA